MISAVAGIPFELLLTEAPAGIGTTLEIEVYDPSDGSTQLPASGAAITEPRGGTYRALRTVSTPGSLAARWTTSGAFLAEEEVIVLAAPAVPALPVGDDVLELSVRTLLQDGRDAEGTCWNLVRLEDLTDQLGAAATPTRTIFMVRFTQNPLAGQVSVYGVPGSLRAYVDGSAAPVLPAVDIDQNGNFTLAVPPVQKLQVSYGWQLLPDSAIAEYVNQAAGWLGLAILDDCPVGLAPALINQAACQACQAIARRCTLSNQRAGDSGADLAELAKSYRESARDFCAAAARMRRDFYAPGEEETVAAGELVELYVPRFEPWS